MSNDINIDTINKEAADSPKNNASSEVKTVESKPDTIQTEPNPDEDNNDSDFDYASQIDDKSSLPVTIGDKNGRAYPIIYDSKKYRISLKNGVEIAKTIKVIDPMTNKKVEEIRFETLSPVAIAPVIKYHNKDTNEVDVLVGWKDGDKELHYKISMKKLLTKSGVQELSKFGVNFTGKKAGDMAEYFSHILA
jgi:hypothetical protein